MLSMASANESLTPVDLASLWELAVDANKISHVFNPLTRVWAQYIPNDAILSPSDKRRAPGRVFRMEDASQGQFLL